MIKKSSYHIGKVRWLLVWVTVIFVDKQEITDHIDILRIRSLFPSIHYNLCRLLDTSSYIRVWVFHSSKYCSSVTERQVLLDLFGWNLLFRAGYTSIFASTSQIQILPTTLLEQLRLYFCILIILPKPLLNYSAILIVW